MVVGPFGQTGLSAANHVLVEPPCATEHAQVQNLVMVARVAEEAMLKCVSVMNMTAQVSTYCFLHIISCYICTVQHAGTINYIQLCSILLIHNFVAVYMMHVI